jgi:hypothetical protein
MVRRTFILVRKDDNDHDRKTNADTPLADTPTRFPWRAPRRYADTLAPNAERSIMVTALQETDRSFLNPVDYPVLTRDSPAPRSLERAPPQWFWFPDAPKRVVKNRFHQRVDFVGSFPAMLSPVQVIL